MSDVSGVIKSIQDIMRKDVGLDGDAQRIGQMVWMFFLKIFDDREAEMELLEDDYTSPLPEHIRWRSWAKDPEGITGDAMLDFVNLQLFPTLKQKLPTHGPQAARAQVIRSVFEDANNFMKSGTLMRQVVNKICEINFNNTADRHTFGSIYEQILKDLQSAGNAGEFYTPRAVTQFIVNRVDPKLDETVLDPACGTGGFLACVVDHKRGKYVKSGADEEVLQGSIRGVEKKALPHMLCVTNMILHGIDTPSAIVHGNTLGRPYKDYSEKDRVNVIVTNPPFGGMEEDGIENNFPSHYRTRETADLFMALILRLLKNNGRAAVVLPDGFLFGEGMKSRLKQALLEEANLHTIVRLPNGVFAPYTGIKTNILFFTKGKPTKDVWFYEHPYPDGVTSYNKSKPMKFEEFETEIAWWGDEADGFKARVETKQAWKVSAGELVSRNYRFDINNPREHEKISYKPQFLLRSLAEQQEKIEEICAELKSTINDCVDIGKISSDARSLFQENLETWTTAVLLKAGPGRGSNSALGLFGVKKLREMILELAVRGKLVGHVTNEDEAISEVAEIRERRKLLEKQGDVKRLKKIPELSQADIPFQLPKNWKWVHLQEVSEYIQRGKSPKYSDYGDVKVVSQKCVQWSGFEIEKARYVNDNSLATYGPERFLRDGDILWNSTGTGTVGRVLTLEVPEAERLVADSHVSIIRLLTNCPRFVEIYLASAGIQQRIEPSHEKALVSGTTNQVELNTGTIASLPIPFPPLAEQKIIVEKVSDLMQLCNRLESAAEERLSLQAKLAESVLSLVT